VHSRAWRLASLPRSIETDTVVGLRDRALIGIRCRCKRRASSWQGQDAGADRRGNAGLASAPRVGARQRLAASASVT